MTLQDFARLTRANVVWLFTFVLIGVAVSGIYTFTLPVQYAASSTGYVVIGSTDGFSGSQLAQRKAESYVMFVNGQGVRDRIQQELGSVPGSISGSVSTNSQTIVITAVTNNGESAAKLANAAIKALGEEIVKVESLGGQSRANVTLYSLYDAKVPGHPFAPDWKRNLALGGVVGLGLGYVFALVRRSLDGRIRYSSDVEDITNKSTLGVIPKAPELEKQRVSGGRDTGIAAESLRQLRTNLRFVSVDDPPRSIVVTSCNPGEGKSTVSANLARLLAEAGQPTILIDADLRRPALHKTFKLDNATGLTQVLAGDASLADVTQRTETKGFHVITSGRIPPNPSELVGSQRMEQIIDVLSKTHMVIVDAPPMLPVTDAGLLTRSCSGALLVLSVGKTYKEQLKLATKLFDQIDGRLLGSVMNLAPRRGLGSVVYGYGYGYGGYQRNYYTYTKTGKKSEPVEVADIDAEERKVPRRRASNETE